MIKFSHKGDFSKTIRFLKNPDSAKLKTPQRVSKKSESSHYIFREQGGVYEREQ